jgi:hypothetical protein
MREAYKLNTTETGDNFFDLIDRRDAKNRISLEKRKRNARGLTGGFDNYDSEKDLFTQININKRNKGDKKERMKIAKLLRQQLGGNFKGLKAPFRKYLKLKYF